MNMKKARQSSPFEPRKKPSFITANMIIKSSSTPSTSSLNKSSTTSSLTSSSLNTNQKVSIDFPVKVWPRKAHKIEDCLYLLTRLETFPLIIICHDDSVNTFSGILRLLLHEELNKQNDCHVLSATMKSNRNIFTKQIKTLGMNVNKSVFIISQHMISFLDSCLPSFFQCGTLVHVGSINRLEFQKRQELVQRQSSSSSSSSITSQILLLDVSNELLTLLPPASIYSYPGRWLPIIQARLSAARKLNEIISKNKGLSSRDDAYGKDIDGIVDDNISSSGDGKDNEGLGNQIQAMRSKLKVLLAKPLPDCPREMFSASLSMQSSSSSSSQVATTSMESKSLISTTSSNESAKIIRIKMIMLGMICEDSVLFGKQNKHKQADSGRSLAITRWLDGRSGAEFNCPWKQLRYGASCDRCSKEAREIIGLGRDYIAKKCGKRQRGESNLSTKSEKSADNTTSARIKVKSHQELSLVPASVRSMPLRIVAFGWRPNHFIPESDEDWGGPYGKACGHNEVAMFYARPFFPLEVLNSHVCSKASPAPGNIGYDGCLEFLQAQCRWFSKPMTAWDDKSFHYIDEHGSHSQVNKDSLLRLDVETLKYVMTNLRRWTCDCYGIEHPQTIIDRILMLLPMLKGSEIGSRFRSVPKLQALIVSYLLV